MGQLMACMHTEPNTDTSSGHPPKARERMRSSYLHQGKPVCKKVFCFLHMIGETRLKNLVKSYRADGVAARRHGNTRRVPHHALSINSTEFVVRFVLNYSEQNGLLLPGRVPGYSRSDVKLLPSSISKRGIWRVYQAAALEDDSVHTVAYSTFCRLWRTLLPSVLIMRPMTDLCWQCQQNSTAILRSANLSDSEKSDTLRKAEEHLRVVQVERSLYTAACEEASRSVRAHFQTNAGFDPPPPASHIPLNSKDIKVHYSFDYAQQVPVKHKLYEVKC